MKKLILILAAITLFSFLSEAQNDIIVDVSSSEKDTIETEYNNAGRYLFAPSSFGLEKGDIYYSTYNILLNDIQYGLSDNFSIGGGASLILTPVHLMATYSYPINEKSSFAVGDLALLGFGFEFYGNLFYGMYTYGNKNNNITIGAGLWTSTVGKDETETITPDRDPPFTAYKIKTNSVSPAFNLSAQLKLSDNLYFITENYGVKLNTSSTADLKGPHPNGEDHDITLRSEHYEEEVILIAGILGLRYISKKNPLNTWQFGAIYIFNHQSEVPDKYTQPGWETYGEDDFGTTYMGNNNRLFIPIPFISYSRKFGKNIR
jgi:hypothetical protein